MNRIRVRASLAIVVFVSLAAAQGFVQRCGNKLVLDGKEFYFNATTCKNHGYSITTENIDNQFNTRVLPYDVNAIRWWIFGWCHYKSTEYPEGVGCDWQMALNPEPGVFDETQFQVLDYIVQKAELEGIKLIFTLGSTWYHTPGIPYLVAQVESAINDIAAERRAKGDNAYADQIVSLFNAGRTQELGYLLGHDWGDYGPFWSNEDIKGYYKEWLDAVILRTNTITGRQYKDEPAIMCWELVNEGRNYCWRRECENNDTRWDARLAAVAESKAWYCEMADYIKSMDPNHLISTGEDGFLNIGVLGLQEAPMQTLTQADLDQFYANHTPAGKEGDSWYALSNWMYDGTDFYKNSECENIDLLSYHSYTWKWGRDAMRWRDTEIVQMCHETFDKPVYISEYYKPDEDLAENYFQHIEDLNIDGLVIFEKVNPEERPILNQALKDYSAAMKARNATIPEGQCPSVGNISTSRMRAAVRPYRMSIADGKIGVTFKSGHGSLTLRTLSGRTIVSKSVSSSTKPLRIAVPTQQAGMYVITISTGSTTESLRVLHLN